LKVAQATPWLIDRGDLLAAMQRAVQCPASCNALVIAVPIAPGNGIHLNDIFHADTSETRQFWSLAPIDPEQSTQQMIAP
jgi:hypothetical protein